MAPGPPGPLPRSKQMGSPEDGQTSLPIGGGRGRKTGRNKPSRDHIGRYDDMMTSSDLLGALAH